MDKIAWETLPGVSVQKIDNGFLVRFPTGIIYAETKEEALHVVGKMLNVAVDSLRKFDEQG